MTISDLKNDERQTRLRDRVYKKTVEEFNSEIESLKQRIDYIPEFDYFLELQNTVLSSEGMQEKPENPLAGLFCIQLPPEIFHALGIDMFKITSGSYLTQRLAPSVPVLMCPMLKSCMGLMNLKEPVSESIDAYVVPTTCDWIVKMPEISGGKMEDVHFVELPHVKGRENSQERWLEEIYELKEFLERRSDKKLTRKNLMSSVQMFMDAWKMFNELVNCRRDNRISSVWFTLIANTFLMDEIETWGKNLGCVVEKIKAIIIEENKKRIFLAGSPVVFPNLKMLNIIEDAGMTVCADDLCTSERIFPGATLYDDPSLDGVLRALSERYHRACMCPTFLDNDRRINNILKVAENHEIDGVVFHVLKGCHPYDIESFTIEEKLKKQGLKFLKIETDYVKEDSQNILTRLEAFRETL